MICYLKNLISFSLLISALGAAGQPVPTAENMGFLEPEGSSRLNLYDRVFQTTAQLAGQNHQRYTDPAVLADVEVRLERVRESGNPEDVFSEDEKVQLEKTLAELKNLESSFFNRWYLKIPMSIAIKFQSWVTRRNSQAPSGRAADPLIEHWKRSAEKNLLYSHWNQELPDQYRDQTSPKTWGELLMSFNQDDFFRQWWVEIYPESLVLLKQFAEIWAWEDSSVRNVRVVNSGTSQEYWVLERLPREHVPNRFETILNGDFEALLRIEYAPTLFFNRLAKITAEQGSVVYHLESVEKGRTMEPSLGSNENGTDKVTFRGAELLRKTKMDEFLQRSYVERGSLNLFLGLRTMQLNQVQDLMKINPELTLAVGQLGLSVTGGMAQTVSNRTDSPREQLLKMTATLIDFIEFSQTTDVPAWFEINTRHVLRTIVGGVGTGGSRALAEPTSQRVDPDLLPANALRCQSVLN